MRYLLCHVVVTVLLVILVVRKRHLVPALFHLPGRVSAQGGIYPAPGPPLAGATKVKLGMICSSRTIGGAGLTG